MLSKAFIMLVKPRGLCQDLRQKSQIGHAK